MSHSSLISTSVSLFFFVFILLHFTWFIAFAAIDILAHTHTHTPSGHRVLRKQFSFLRAHKCDDNRFTFFFLLLALECFGPCWWWRRRRQHTREHTSILHAAIADRPIAIIIGFKWSRRPCADVEWLILSAHYTPLHFAFRTRSHRARIVTRFSVPRTYARECVCVHPTPESIYFSAAQVKSIVFSRKSCS